MEIEEILRSFDIYDRTYKRDAVDAAISQREEVVPRLISVLEDVIHAPETYCERGNQSYGYIYAFMLLGLFNETRAHDVIIDLFSLPGELPDDLFGYFVTEELPYVLLRTCGGVTGRIKELALNKDAFEYCRSGALVALSYACIKGLLSREELFSFFKGLFSEDVAPLGASFYDILAPCVYDMYPEELMDTIKTAYDEGLIFSGFIRYEDFLDVLKKNKETCLSRFEARIESQQLDNLHDKMSRWDCFKGPEKVLKEGTAGFNPDFNPSSKPKNKSKASKSKAKQVKASKKANRKKKKK